MKRQSFLLVLPITIASCAVALAEPTISGLSLRGLRRGATTRVEVTGKDLLPDPRIILPFPVAEQVVVGEARSDRVVFDLKLDERSVIGIHQLRLATPRGISNALAVGVDGLDQYAFGDRAASLPVAMSGTIAGPQILETVFAGRKGDAVVVEVESRRLGAALRPVVRLMDPQGRQITWSGGRDTIGGDARAQAVLESDGDYTVQLHDALYRAPAPGFFRLKIGDFRFADLAFPLAVRAGTATTLELVSTNLPSSFAVPLESDDAVWVGTRGIALGEAAGLFSGSLPRVVVSDHAEFVEDAGVPEPQSVTAAPVAVSGRIAKPDEVDRYHVDVKPESKLRMDLLASRGGSPLDGVLVVRDESGKELARNDDRPATSDPGLDVTVPAGASRLVVSIEDLHGRGGDDFIYRLSIEDLSLPDFSLSVDADRINVPAGGSQVIRVTAVRRRYGGPIDLSVEGLPAEIAVAGNRIPAGGSIALLTLSAPAAGGPHFGLAAVVGRAAKPGLELVRRADSAGAPGDDRQPWFRSELGLARAEPSSLGLDWTIAAGAKLLRGVRAPAHATVTRRDEAPGPIRFRLLTTQVMPRKKVKQNDKEVEVDDVDRALRLADEVVLEAAAVEADLALAVPADLPDGPWSVVLVAERLSEDKKTVLSAAVSGVKTFGVESPLAIELEGAPRVEGKAGVGETGSFTGRVRRAEGFTLPVTVSLAALPKELPAPSTVVAPGTDTFSLPVSFPYGTKPGELKDVKLLATALPDPMNAELLVTSNEIPVTIDVVAGEKPAAEKPLAIFEDEAEFLAYLTEGDGQVELDSGDKHSGSAALRVTPVQRFSPSIPTLGLKIRQNPGPGEYRYLRFAWKKVGGTAVCLQLNHDGMWGPGGMARAGATFRYHAGPGEECFGASTAIDKALPTKFVVVTRDLFADFGEFTLTGLAFSPIDGRYAVYDQLYLGRGMSDFDELAKGE